MTEVLQNTVKLIQILDLLNNFVKNYTLYIYLIDLEYRLLWFNQHMAETLHLTENSLQIPCYQALWGLNSRCGDCPALGEKETNRFMIQRELKEPPGEIYLEFLSLPVTSPQGEIEAYLRIGFDVTAVEEEQRELRRKEKLFSSIIETSSDAIFLLDKDDNILTWNRGAEEIFGYTAEEAIGKSQIILIPKEMVELGEIFYLKKELAEKGQIYRYETQRIDKTGRMVHVDFMSTLLKNDRNEMIGSSVMMKDISTRKALEIELRQNIMELTKLNDFNEILHTTYILDDILRIFLVAVTAGEGLRFNRAFLFLRDQKTNRLCGHLAVGAEDEFQAHHIWMALQEKVHSWRDIINHYQINQQGFDKKLNELVRKIQIPLEVTDNIFVNCLLQKQVIHIIDGNPDKRNSVNLNFREMNLMELLGTRTFLMVPLVFKAESLGVLLVDNKFTGKDIKDEEIESLRVFANQASLAIENARLYDKLEERIKELKEAYRQLELNANRLVKAERLAAVGEMAASVAHEIRNPLVSVGGFARLLEKRIPDNQDVQKYSSIIVSQVEHLESLLNNILNIANPKKPKKRILDIHNIIRQVMVVMNEIVKERKIELDMKMDCPKATIMGDEKLLFQALLNLTKNAVEAMTDEKKLKLTTQCDEKFIRIRIEDSGQGIPGKNLEKIYHPFFTTKRDGTGLGMTVVRQIIEDHQGKIEIESKIKQGTVVSLLLPRSLSSRN